MEAFLQQIDVAAEQGNYLLALHGALVVPDIIGALEHKKGVATQDAYVRWFDREIGKYYVLESGPSFDGRTAYKLRCSMVHQHRTAHPHGRYKSVVFCRQMDNIVIKAPGGDEYLAVDALTFCQRVTSAARRWLQEHASARTVRQNLGRTPQTREGFLGLINGVTVVF